VSRYRSSRRQDRYVNTFRYRAKVYEFNHQDTSRWAYNLYLVGAPGMVPGTSLSGSPKPNDRGSAVMRDVAYIS
jgi:hypothetical protein